jgi:hypothetical protein
MKLTGDFPETIRKADAFFRECEEKLRKTEDQQIDLNLIDPQNYAESLKDLVRKIRGPAYDVLAEEIFAKLTELFSLFLSSPDSQRKVIRELFNGRRHIANFLTSYPAYISSHIESPSDADLLRLGFVAAAVAGDYIDFRDMYVSLGTLYQQALAAKLDPASQLRSIQSETGSSLLRSFSQSDHLKSLLGGNDSPDGALRSGLLSD